MELNSALKKLNESSGFISWKNKSKDIFFSYAFRMIEENSNKSNEDWQLGFYNKTTDKITTFTVNDAGIEIQQEQEIFKKPGMQVNPLDIKKVKVPFEKILKETAGLQKKECPAELAGKTIAVLQNLEGYGTIWNITCIMRSFKTLNVKINAETGKIMAHSLESLMSFIKK
ncbi:hypothetical protein KY347_04855 [Candidatus Woesearchaeota archaeon]|nr:hypothetical protein [Candidatus Woesearchaeota archaeon]